VKLYQVAAGKGQCDMMEVAALEPVNPLQRVAMRGGYDMRDVKCDLVQFADKDVVAKVRHRGTRCTRTACAIRACPRAWTQLAAVAACFQPLLLLRAAVAPCCSRTQHDACC
jgi:hypothetical protein